MSTILLPISITLFVASAILFSIYILKSAKTKTILRDAEQKSKVLLQEAERRAESITKEASLEAKEKILSAKSEFDEQTKERRRELQEYERKLIQKEEYIEKRLHMTESKEHDLIEWERRLRHNSKRLSKTEREYHMLIREQQRQLERISSMSPDEAKKALMDIMENEARKLSAKKLKQIDDETKEKAKEIAKNIISLAIQRCASEHVVESTVSVVDLPNDEMKGRIIGREGRNIRSFEIATGVDLIIDDTPEAVIISCFDPLRREIASISLQRLITDGRIHPARIEEIAEKVKEELAEKISKEGETAILELGIKGLHPELTKLLGKLKYRSSYGQNILQHSKEVAILAGIMAVELEANVEVAKRGGLLHDIGKAVDRESEGTHTQIAIDLLRKYNESNEIIHCVEAHHFDVDPNSIEAVLVQAADSISAARPGARREILENYIKRLEKLEQIADSFQGVSKAFAIQAGREIRIVVQSDKVSDEEATWLSNDIAKRIENELEYPGEIKVTVIRETRAIDYAR
jgi:ribonuclease Y